MMGATRAVRHSKEWKSTLNLERKPALSTTSTVLKVLLFTLPTTVVTEMTHVTSHVVIGSLWVAGAFLQAVVPPRKRGLIVWIVGATVAAGAYVFLAK
jgi:hypothetical protein